MDTMSAQLDFQIDRVVEALKAGGIVAFPTDTVYGLGADATNRKAIEKIYRVKQRPFHLPLPVLLADMTQIDTVASYVSDFAQFLMKRFWPGGLTLVLPRAESLPESITSGSDKVAVRIPDHVVPLTIIRRLDMPVVGTSANISDEPSVLTAQEVAAQLGDGVDLIIDGGICPGGIESTVVDVSKGVPLILRHGIIPDSEIENAYNEYTREDM